MKTRRGVLSFLWAAVLCGTLLVVPPEQRPWLVPVALMAVATLLFLREKKTEILADDWEIAYRGLCDNSRDPTLVLTPQGVVVYANTSYREVTGFQLETLVRQTVLQSIPERYHSECEELLERARQGEETERVELELEAEGGVRIPVDGSFHLAPGPGERPDCLVGIFEDLRERKEAEKALRESEERFRHAQKMEAVGRLAGGVAHDFNNLLTVIFSYASFIEADAEDPESVLSSVKELLDTSSRAANLTKQLLLFSRRQKEGELDVVEMNPLITEMSHLAKRILGERITLQLSLEASCDKVLGDRAQLEQIVMNLLVNAKDAMPEGGQIELKSADVYVDKADAAEGLDSGHYVQFSVRDSGCGIDSEILEQIFEPYFTTKSVGRGTGLGLPTVYAIVKFYNGGIRVDSEPDQGTEFKVLLPVAGATPQRVGEAPEVSQRRGGETILLVEDEDAVRGAVSRMLKRSGYSVVEARDAEEGMALLDQGEPRFDLLVTDLVLPKMSGPELARIYSDRCPKGKILFVSGYPADRVTEPGFPGDGAFLAKPFRRQDLNRKLKELLDREPV